MKIFLYILLISYSGCEISRDIIHHPKWYLLDHDQCGESYTDRIIGGTAASLGQFPWMVRLGYRKTNNTAEPVKFKCGGSLINHLYVITAGHCTKTPLRLAMLRLGESDTETDPDCEDEFCAPAVQDYEPAEITIHRNYMKPRLRNDIALVRLNRPVTFNSFVTPICLPHGSLLNKNHIGSIVETAGWGVSNVVRRRTSPILLHVRLPVVDKEKCEETLAKYTTVSLGRSQLCAGGQIGYDSCSGDSGGPLMKVEAVDGPPKYYLIGLVSFGWKTCGIDAPAVYTNVAKFMGWILNKIEP